MSSRIDDTDDFAAKLLRAGKKEAPSRASRRRLLGALGLAPFLLSSGFWARHGWKVVVTSIAATAIGSALFHRAPARSDSRVDAHVATAPTIAEAPSAVAPSTAAAPSSLGPPLVAPARSLADAPGASANAHAVIAVPSSDAPSPASAASELPLIVRAKLALRDRDPRAALSALDAHAAAFPDGALTEEAAALRVEALAARGDTIAAHETARAFFARYPASAYTRRVAASLTSADGPSSSAPTPNASRAASPLAPAVGAPSSAR